MNFVDVSDATLATEWRQLMAFGGIDPSGLETAIKEERGEPLSISEYTPEQLADAQDQTVAMVRPMLSRPLKGLFAWRFPNWAVTDSEIDELAEVYALVFAKYFPDFYQNPIAVKIAEFVEGVGLEAKALVLTWRFFQKRKGIPARLPKEPEQKAAGNGSTPESSQQVAQVSAPDSPLPNEV